MKTTLIDGPHLYVQIEYSEPVELNDFAKSMQGIADDFKQRQSSNPNEPTKLYICEIKKGSIIATLAPLMPLAVDFIDGLDTVSSYVEYFKTVKNWLLGEKEEPEKMNTTQLTNYSKIISPIVKDKAAQLNIGTINNTGNGNVNINVTINHAEAVVTDQEARKQIAYLKAKDFLTDQMHEIPNDEIAGKHEYVVMYWDQLAAIKTKDQGVIESLWPKPVKVVMTKEIKNEIVHDAAFPFTKAFLVDVIVETIEGKPKLYKITKYHETIDKD